MLPALAPILPHLAEDAWQNAPWAVPTASVFQSGWFSPHEQWQAMPEPEQRAFRALKLIRWTISLQLHHSVICVCDVSLLQPSTLLNQCDPANILRAWLPGSVR